MKKWKIAGKACCFFLCVILLIGGLTVLLKDKRVTFPYDTTRKIEGFYAEEKNSLDFVFIGSSEMFTSVVPTVLWQEYGITSYDFGANEQTLELSYTYVQEALKYQNPKAIVLEISYCAEPNQAREGVKRINLDDLRWGMPKIQAIWNTTGWSERWSYFFELSKYHDTWDSLDETSMSYIFADKHNPYKGYTPSEEGIFEGAEFQEEILEITESRELSENPAIYLEKIIQETKAQGVGLCLLKTPNGNQEDQAYYNKVEEIARENGIPFLNLNKEMGGERHNHITYADDITLRIGEFLLENYEVEDKRGQTAYASWDQDAKYYEHYRHHAYFQTKNTFSEYVAHAIEGDCVVLLAVNDDAPAIKEAVNQESLRSYGLEVNFQQGDSYLAIFDGEKIYEEQVSPEIAAYQGQLFDQTVILISYGENAGQYAEISLDGTNYAREDATGVNVVIYDPLLEQVVDHRTFYGNGLE